METSSSLDHDLLSIGTHCNHGGCHRLDFLPFKCEKCHGTFCLDHRTGQQHSCINQEIGNIEVPQCPLCHQYIRRGQKQSANDQIETHIMSGCRDLVVAMANKKQRHPNRCTHGSCKRYELIPFLCPSCDRQYCIRHRLESAHNCVATPTTTTTTSNGNSVLIRVKS